MSGYYYNEELAVVYKVGPVAASLVKDKNENGQEVILVHTTIKMTNFKREKVRRTISKSTQRPIMMKKRLKRTSLTAYCPGFW